MRTEITYAEYQLLQWQFNSHMMGSWQRQFWNLLSISDSGNLNSLELGFPDEVKAYRRFTTERGYWQELVDYAKKDGWFY